MKSLYLFRHGETDFNRDGRFQGHLDIPLNETGRAQSRELGRLLRALVGEGGIQATLSSDLTRARESAELVATELGLDPAGVITTPGLREANLGDVQGLSLEEIREKVGAELLGRWKSSLPTDADVAYPGGESGTAVRDRAFAALEAAALASPARAWVVATHGGVIRRLMHRLLPPDSPPVRIPNTVAYRFEFDERTRQWLVPDPTPLF